jgi:Glucose / Sorbosone dehydrogenase
VPDNRIGDGPYGPSGFEIAPDGRIFILERSGNIKIVKDGALLPTPFTDIPSEDWGDRGLIGVAFDPDFGVSNGPSVPTSSPALIDNVPVIARRGLWPLRRPAPPARVPVDSSAAPRHTAEVGP